MWSLASTVKGNNQVRDLAIRTLFDLKARRREMAFRYLRDNYPEEATAMFFRFEEDQDPALLDALGCFIQSQDPIKAVHLFIDALLDPLQLGGADTVVEGIINSGCKEHVARLRELRQQHRNPRLLAEIAALLEKRLRKE
jgi:hypothetical protein